MSPISEADLDVTTDLPLSEARGHYHMYLQRAEFLISGARTACITGKIRSFQHTNRNISLVTTALSTNLKYSLIITGITLMQEQ